jgi:O-antigen/teichoic acid export membrane protein
MRYIKTIKEYAKEIYNNFNSDARSKTLNKNLIISVAVKMCSVLISFFLIPITLKYVNTNEYGIWLTISSMYAFISIVDVGLGNGLRVKLGEALSKKDLEQAKSYVSTTYISLIIILIPVTIILFYSSNYINWCSLFKIEPKLSITVTKLVGILIVAFTTRIFLSLISTILTSLQKTGINSILDLSTNLIIALLIITLGKSGEINLYTLGIIYSTIPLIILGSYSLFYFLFKNIKLKPSFNYFQVKDLKQLLGLGGKYFLLQLCGIIILSSGNIIIATLISPSEVTNYNLTQQYFSVIAAFYGFIVIPLVPAYNDAYYHNDFDWIKVKIAFMKKMWFFTVFIVALLILFSGWFFKLWLGDKIHIPFLLICSVGVYWVIVGWSTIYSPFINGIGKVNIQLIQGILSVILTIGISFFLIKLLNIGASGYVFSSTISITIGAIFLNIQYKKLINRKASGIWNK